MSNQRRNLSNIGIRRQKALYAGDVALTISHDNQTRQSSTQIEQDHVRPTRNRLGNLRRAGLVRSRYGSQESRFGKFAGEHDKENQPPTSSSDGTNWPRSDGDENSALAIWNNPALDLLPVAKTDNAKQAFDFYVNSFVTSIVEVSPQNTARYSSLVHQILHDELLFTAFTTCSEATRWRTQNLYDDPPASVSRGYGKTLTLLAKKLQTERFAMSPTVLLTMGQLVAIETMIKNVSATARHLAGMQAAVKPKGPEQPPKGSQPVSAAVDVWTQYFIYRGMVKSKMSRTNPLFYPKHPFAPKAIDQVAALPGGLQEIALSGRLSLEILDLVGQFQGYLSRLGQDDAEGTRGGPERTKNILLMAAYCIEYHQIQTLTLIERLIVTALTAYVVRRDRIPPEFVNIRNYLQITCAYALNLISASENALEQQDRRSDLIHWIGLVLLLTCSPEAHGRKLALRLLPKRPEPMKMLARCQEFFWDDHLTAALVSGSVLITTASNDVIADNVKQTLED